MKSKNGIKNIIVVLVLVALVVGYFFYLSNRNKNRPHEEDIKISPAQEIILTNYDIEYPPTPKEVVKEYMEITKVLHNTDLEEEELTKVALKLQELFDTELVQNKSEEDYLKDLKSELATFRNNDYSIVNYYTSSSTDVEEYTMDGFKLAKLYGTYDIRTSAGTQALRDVFVLRKDDRGRWKIYGWQPVANEE